MEESELDTTCTENPTCPYCGYEVEDDGEMEASESMNETSCNNCGKSYRYSANISYSWNTYKAPCLNGIPHEWTEWKDLFDDEEHRRCSVCSKREYRGKEAQGE